MRNLTVVDETFDINISSSYHLSIQMSSAGFCFAILDTVRKKYIGFKNILFDESLSLSHEDQVKRFLQRDIYLNRPYKSAGFIFANPDYVIVPNPLYDPGQTENLFSFSNKLQGDHQICTSELRGMDARVLFSAPKKIIDALEDHLSDFHILHQSCPFIENAALAARRSASGIQVMAMVFPDFFDILVFLEGKIELYNSFRHKSDQDLIFYILYVFEQFNLNTSETSILLSGLMEEDDKLVKRLSQFVPHLKFDRFNRNYSYSYTFGQISQHQFSNLINIYSCV